MIDFDDSLYLQMIFGPFCCCDKELSPTGRDSMLLPDSTVIIFRFTSFHHSQKSLLHLIDQLFELYSVPIVPFNQKT